MHNAAALRAARDREAARKPAVRSFVAAPLDLWLFTAVAALVAIGLVMVFSASSATAYAEHGDIAYYLKRQLMWLVVGLAGAFVCYRIDYQRLRAIAPYLLVAAIGGLLLVFVPHIGLGVNGGRRWIGTGGLSLEPSEFAKLALVIYLSAMLSARGERITSLGRGLFPLCVPVAIMAVLVLKEPDMGTASLLLFTALALFFAAGARLVHLAAIVLTTVPFAVLTVLASPYRRARVFAFVDPWKDPLNTGFHIVQSLLALGSGGIFGVGLGASRAKFFYLPEQYTDFIFSVLGEELGLIGTLAVDRALRDRCLSRGEDRAGRARSLRLLPGHRLRRDDRDPGVREHRRRLVVVAGHRRAVAVHLLRRKLADRQPNGRRTRCQRGASSQSQSSKVTVLFAGGGTGGHLYPAIAIADALRGRANVAFVGSAERLESTIVPKAGYHLYTISAHALPRRVSPALARAAVENFAGIAQSLRLLASQKPDIVVATGGYVCFPVAFAARVRRIARRSRARIVLLEPNRSPGVTARVLAPLVDEISGECDGFSERMRAKCRATGVPVRYAPQRLPSRIAAAGRLGLDPNARTLLVIGGSQGAKTLNDAVLRLLRSNALPRGWQVLALTGAAQFAATEAALAAERRRNVVLRPYLDDMSDAYAVADLVSGASGRLDARRTGSIGETRHLGSLSLCYGGPPSGERGAIRSRWSGGDPLRRAARPRRLGRCSRAGCRARAARRTRRGRCPARGRRCAGAHPRADRCARRAKRARS